MENLENILKDVQRTQTLAESGEELGKQVYALYTHALEVFKEHYKDCDLFEKYYRPGGNKSKNRPSYLTNTSHNVIFSNIESAKPVIESALVKPGIYPTNPNDSESCEMLEKRVASAWKDSGLQIHRAEELIHDVIVDGTAFIKTIYNRDERNMQGDVRAILLNNRNVMFDPAGQLEDSPFVLHTTLASVGETRQMFSKLPKNFEGITKQLDSDKDKPKGSVAQSGTGDNTTFTSSTSGRLYANGESTDYSQAFQQADKVIRIECWFKDMTLTSDNDLKYPYGRIITICVGAAKDGSTKYVNEGKDIEIVVVKNEDNPYKTLYEYTSRFPFFQIQCHNTKDIWGIGEVANQTDTQDLLNDAINTTHDNWKLNNNPIKVGLKKYGLTKDSIKNRPGEVVLIDAPDVDDARKAWTTMMPPMIAQYTLPFINLYTQLNERDSGVADATRGVRPSGVTSGRAISELSDRADNKFLLIARAINNAFIKAYQSMAYIAQEFDEASDEGFFLDNEDVNPLMATAEERFIEYNPQETEGVKFKVEAVRQSSMEEILQILDVVSKLDAQVPGMGAIALEYSKDKRVRDLYQKLMADIRQQQQQAQQAQQQEQNNQMTQQLLTQNSR